MSCYFKAMGAQFKPDKYIELKSFDGSKNYIGGYRNRKPVKDGNQHNYIVVNVSKESFEKPEKMTQEIIEFLKINEMQLAQLKRDNTVEYAYIEIAYDCRLNDTTSVIQYDFLESNLLMELGALGIGLNLCLNLPFEG